MPGMSLVKSTIRRIERVMFCSVIEVSRTQIVFFAKSRPAGYLARMSLLKGRRTIAAAMCLLLAFAASARAADLLDPAPRIAVMSAFEPEWKVLKADVVEP